MESSGNSEYRHHDLQGRILRKIDAADTEGQMLKILKDRFEMALADEVVVMGRNKRKDLWVQIARIILERMIKGLESGTD